MVDRIIVISTQQKRGDIMKFELHYKDENGTTVEGTVIVETPNDLRELSGRHGGKSLLLEFGKAFDNQRIVIRKDDEEWI